MFIEILITLIVAGLIRFFSRRERQQSEPDVSQGLRKQIIKIISNARSDVPEQKKNIQETHNNQTTEHYQDQSRSEFWNEKHYILGVVVVIFTVLIFLFGDGILIRLLHWLSD